MVYKKSRSKCTISNHYKAPRFLTKQESEKGSSLETSPWRGEKVMAGGPKKPGLKGGGGGGHCMFDKNPTPFTRNPLERKYLHLHSVFSPGGTPGTETLHQETTKCEKTI